MKVCVVEKFGTLTEVFLVKYMKKTTYERDHVFQTYVVTNTLGPWISSVLAPQILKAFVIVYGTLSEDFFS